MKIIAETLNGRCRYVVVKNQAHSDYFKIYEQSKLRVRLMEELGGREIVMPKLYDWLVTALNEANLPITEAIKHPEISLVDRQRLKNWQALFNEQIEQVREVLLPGLEKVKGTGKRAKAKTEEATAEQPAS